LLVADLDAGLEENAGGAAPTAGSSPTGDVAGGVLSLEYVVNVGQTDWSSVSAENNRRCQFHEADVIVSGRSRGVRLVVDDFHHVDVLCSFTSAVEIVSTNSDLSSGN